MGEPVVGEFVKWHPEGGPRKRGRTGWIIAENGCHIWTGAKNSLGYGRVTYQGRILNAHRARYLREIGPIPEGMQLDHLCRNPSCVNPAHMEIVTPQENTLRSNAPAAANVAKTHCPKGHPYSGDNLVLFKRHRGCRQCRKANRARLHVEAADRRGACPLCGYRHPVRTNGTMQAHMVYNGSVGRRCPGSGLPPKEAAPTGEETK